MQVCLEDSDDQELGLGGTVQAVEALPRRADRRGVEDLRSADPVKDEGQALGQVPASGRGIAFIATVGHDEGEESSVVPTDVWGGDYWPARPGRLRPVLATFAILI